MLKIVWSDFEIMLYLVFNWLSKTVKWKASLSK